MDRIRICANIQLLPYLSNYARQSGLWFFRVLSDSIVEQLPEPELSESGIKGLLIVFRGTKLNIGIRIGRHGNCKKKIYITRKIDNQYKDEKFLIEKYDYEMLLTYLEDLIEGNE